MLLYHKPTERDMTNDSCLCGKVTFQISGQLPAMSHCHCSICRKIHGSLFATCLEASELSYTSGQAHIQEYASSQGFQRAFCNACGSVLPEASTLQGNKVFFLFQQAYSMTIRAHVQSRIFSASQNLRPTLFTTRSRSTHTTAMAIYPV